MEPKQVENLSNSGELASQNEQKEAEISISDETKNAIAHNAAPLIADDTEVWQAYLASKKQWQEVYRRLADS